VVAERTPFTRWREQHTAVDRYENHVARGIIEGARIVNAFGEIDALAGTTNHIIWPLQADPTLNIPSPAGEQIEFVSTSAQDAAGGTGITTVQMHYLDGNLDPANEEIPLNGLTPVRSQATDVRFIQCLHMDGYGGTRTAEGNISAYEIGDATNIYSYIAAGSKRCSSSARRVPRGKILFVKALWGGVSSGTAAARGTIRLVTTYLEGHDYTEDGITMPQAGISLQDASVTLTLDQPLPVPPGVVVAMETTVDKDATVNGGWAGWWENAPPVQAPIS